MKDHETRELVNRLTKIAIDFHGAQQLRERIAGQIVPVCKLLDDDLITHRETWHNALMYAMSMASVANNEADYAYWKHEIAVFNRVFDAIAAGPK